MSSSRGGRSFVTTAGTSEAEAGGGWLVWREDSDTGSFLADFFFLEFCLTGGGGLTIYNENTVVPSILIQIEGITHVN